MAYATEAQLLEYLTMDATPTITVPQAARLLQRASDLIDYETFYRLEGITDATILEAAQNATCAQVEYWLEIDESTAISGYKGDVKLGNLTMTVNYDTLAPRAKQYLMRHNLLYQGLPHRPMRSQTTFEEMV